MGQPAYTRTALVQLLRDNGPMSAAELTERIELNRKTVNAAIISARKKYGTQFFRIVRYEFTRGRGGREVPIYDVGPGEDCRKPHMGQTAAKARHARYRKKMRHVLNARNRMRRGKTAANPYQQLITG